MRFTADEITCKSRKRKRIQNQEQIRQARRKAAQRAKQEKAYTGIQTIFTASRQSSLAYTYAACLQTRVKVSSMTKKHTSTKSLVDDCISSAESSCHFHVSDAFYGSDQRGEEILENQVRNINEKRMKSIIISRPTSLF